MEIGLLAVSIPIVAIVMSFASAMLKRWTDHQEAMARLRGPQHVMTDSAAGSQIDDLRREIAALRDTTTQYDMSVERALDEIRHRLTSVETHIQPTARAARESVYKAAADETEVVRQGAQG